jgi:hypothetical protein
MASIAAIEHEGMTFGDLEAFVEDARARGVRSTAAMIPNPPGIDSGLGVRLPARVSHSRRELRPRGDTARRLRHQ